MWQVAGLTFLWYVGSPQSKEEEERNNEMLQWLVRKIDPVEARKFLSEWTINTLKSNPMKILLL